jgi:hypothetical protein
MVAKVNIGKTIRGVLSYNENKVKEGTAACIKAEGFPMRADGLSFNDKLQTFLDCNLTNPKVKTNAIHISLNFDPSEKFDNDKLGKIASGYLSKIGFGDQPYLVYQHFDAAHPHVHLVTTNVKMNGERIDLHNIGRNISEQARKEIEVEFNLVKAQGRTATPGIIKAADLSRATYGKSETKRTVSNIVNAVIHSYRFTSIHELNAILKQYNVVADRGREGTIIHSKNGLRYSIINKDGIPVGVPIKASSIYGQPTLTKLSGQFSLNELLRAPHRKRVETAIDSFDGFRRGNLEDFVRHLASNQIYTVLRQNDEGRIYGITFIDNSTRCVFNGSALGKQYSAQGILSRFERHVSSQKVNTSRIPAKEWDGQIQLPAAERNHSELLEELTKGNFDRSNSPNDLKRRKRKGRRI